ncbi:unnamed protein product [Acanthoscelides obtectus]|uniref:HTH psq-type domain-containing protein n=1 Tax=Acanthoscelides obtectus TaxID=200917 RepID=A0A9P0M470_ACAOB|nr:unnamed protein product [Acanthoscelides obtectus]CAK1661215.1 hypothetical protein AOBTE_LOCUS22519 [Acanthoscelides obtectus]
MFLYTKRCRVKSDKAYRRVNRTTTVFKRIIYYPWNLLAKSKSIEDYIFPAQANNCRSLHPVSQFEVKLRAVLLMNSKKKMSKVNNKKKTKREYCGWTSEDMYHAINAYKQNQCGFNECCRRYNIPKPTFRRHLRSLNKKANENVKSLGRHTTFSPETEMELTKHILKLEERFFGVTIRDILDI